MCKLIILTTRKQWFELIRSRLLIILFELLSAINILENFQKKCAKKTKNKCKTKTDTWVSVTDVKELCFLIFFLMG